MIISFKISPRLYCTLLLFPSLLLLSSLHIEQSSRSHAYFQIWQLKCSQRMFPPTKHILEVWKGERQRGTMICKLDIIQGQLKYHLETLF